MSIRGFGRKICEYIFGIVIHSQQIKANSPDERLCVINTNFSKDCFHVFGFFKEKNGSFVVR